MKINKMPIIEGLLKYRDENIIPFHTPGHRNNKKEFEELNIIKENLYKFDNTEVDGLDNLHIPEGMIKEAQNMAAKAFKAGESFFLVNGSTCGIYSMILGNLSPNDKIIVQRNCHRSVYMACLLGNLDTVYVNPKIIEPFNIPGVLHINDIIKVMDKNIDAKAIILTYPTYHGICSNLEEIVKEAHKRGIIVLVDEAHGAHLPFNKKLPKCAMECGADVSVTSIHKSLPALTQVSLLNIRDGFNTNGIKFMLRIFQSTSPSYVFMASIDAARYIMEDRGNKLLDELLTDINDFRNNISSLEGFRLISREYKDKYGIYDIDSTKIVISSKIGGRELEEILRKNYGIQVEMSDIYNITIIGTVGDTKDSYKRLYEALCDIDKKHKEYKYNKIDFKNFEYNAVMNMNKAYYASKERVLLKDSIGSVSSSMLCPYPPGIPVIVPGEIITKEIAWYIEFIKNKGIPINGLDDENGEYIDILRRSK